MGFFDSAGSFFEGATGFLEQAAGAADKLADVKSKLEGFGNFGTPSVPSFYPSLPSIGLPKYSPTTTTAPPPGPGQQGFLAGGGLFLVGVGFLALLVLKR